MIKIILTFLGLTTCLLLQSGCEWTTGGGATTWNDRENFVDFSGAYKASDGGVLVRKPGANSGSITNITTNTVSGELLSTGDGTKTAFSGILAHPPPLPGTLTIVVGGYRFADLGSSSAGTVVLTVSPADGSSGTINLDTGAWTLSFPSPIASGTQILSAYQYLTSVVTPDQGNHGDPIYTFVLYQQGNTIQIVDDCGSKYEGNIGSVRTTGGVPIDLDPSNQLTVPTTGPIVAQLYATGYSQGYSVQITGVLQGTLTSASTLVNRTMQATFVEIGGYDADVNGAAQ